MLYSQSNMTRRCTTVQRPPWPSQGDEEEGVSNRSADALSAIHGRNGLDKIRGVISGTEPSPV